MENMKSLVMVVSCIALFVFTGFNSETYAATLSYTAGNGSWWDAGCNVYVDDVLVHSVPDNGLPAAWPGFAGATYTVAVPDGLLADGSAVVEFENVGGANLWIYSFTLAGVAVKSGLGDGGVSDGTTVDYITGGVDTSTGVQWDWRFGNEYIEYTLTDKWVNLSYTAGSGIWWDTGVNVYVDDVLVHSVPDNGLPAVWPGFAGATYTVAIPADLVADGNAVVRFENVGGANLWIYSFTLASVTVDCGSGDGGVSDGTAEDYITGGFDSSGGWWDWRFGNEYIEYTLTGWRVIKWVNLRYTAGNGSWWDAGCNVYVDDVLVHSVPDNGLPAAWPGFAGATYTTIVPADLLTDGSAVVRFENVGGLNLWIYGFTLAGVTVDAGVGDGGVSDGTTVDYIIDSGGGWDWRFGNEYIEYVLLLSVKDAFLTPAKVNVMRNAEHSFKIHIISSVAMDVNVSDTAKVTVTGVVEGLLKNYVTTAEVSSVDVPGDAKDIAIKVYVTGGLDDNDPAVAISSINGIPIGYSLAVGGGSIDDLVLDTFSSGRKGN